MMGIKKWRSHKTAPNHQQRRYTTKEMEIILLPEIYNRVTIADTHSCNTHILGRICPWLNGIHTYSSSRGCSIRMHFYLQ